MQSVKLEQFRFPQDDHAVYEDVKKKNAVVRASDELATSFQQLRASHLHSVDVYSPRHILHMTITSGKKLRDDVEQRKQKTKSRMGMGIGISLDSSHDHRLNFPQLRHTLSSGRLIGLASNAIYPEISCEISISNQGINTFFLPSLHPQRCWHTITGTVATSPKWHISAV
jgi:hypothetical protein